MIWGVLFFLGITRFSSQFTLQWATCSVFLMVIAFAMAELGSSAPTSGMSLSLRRDMSFSDGSKAGSTTGLTSFHPRDTEI
jgi:hypothetical protein